MTIKGGLMKKESFYNKLRKWYNEKYPNGYNVYPDYNYEISDMEIDQILKSKNPYDQFLETIMFSDEYEFIIINEITREAIKDGFKNSKINELLNIQNFLQEIVQINYPIEHYLNQEVCVDIFVDTGDSNYDYVSNAFYPHYNGRKTAYEDIESVTQESSLFWLAETQVYNDKEFFDSIQNDVEYEKSKFIISVYNEIANMPCHMPQLVFLKQFTLRELIDIVENEKDIKIDKNTICGLYDKWSGGGSVLEIELEKPVEIPYKYTQILPHESYTYNIKDCYGVTDNFWR